MRRTCLFFLLVCFCVLLPGPAVRAADPPHRAVAGPFTLSRDGGTPLVEVTFSSGKTGLFMIDTGAYDSVMTPACMKRLGYKQDDNALYLRGFIYDGVTLKLPTVQVHDLRVGRLQVSDITFAVAPGEIGTENGRPVDGLLGGNLLSRFALLLDYPHRTLSWIYPGTLDDETVAELGLDPKSALGLHQEEYFGLDFKINHYSTRVPLHNGEQSCTEEMFFDTGAPTCSLSDRAAQRLKLTSVEILPFTFVFQSPDYANRGEVPSFQLGAQVFSNVSVIYPTHAHSDMVPLIGANVLGGCVVLFDFGPHRCFLKPVLPGLAPGPLPPVNANTVDWERLRNAPEPLGLPPLVLSLLFPEMLEGLPQEIAHRRAALTGGIADADGYAKLAALLRQSEDEAGAKLAAEQDVRLRQADADAHPEDADRAAQWTNALVLAGQTEPALAAAEKNAAKWPASPSVLRSLGLAQETRAVFLLLGKPGETVTDDQAADLSLSLGPKPGKPDPAHQAQIAALRHQARDSYGRAVALAPQDPAGYNRRARFWLLDFLLGRTLEGLGVKSQTISSESALAAELADFRTEVRLLPDDPAVLRRVVSVDTALPQFHDDGWFRKHLRGTGQENELQGSSPTAKTALAHLTALSENSSSKTAAPALESLGALQADRDDPAAEATLRKALARDPARPGALGSLASLMIADNRLSALGDLLLKQSDAAATPASCLLLSETLSAVGQTATAEEEAREALKRLPDSPEANMALARLLLARSGDDSSVLPEAGACLTAAETGLGAFASPAQKAALQTLQAVRLALSGDPAAARTRLLQTLHDRPTCTQAREALYALSVPPSAPRDGTPIKAGTIAEGTQP